MYRPTLFLSPEAPAAPAPPAVPPVSPEQRATALTLQLLATHGTPDAAMRHLVLENQRLEQAASAHERTIADLTGKLPKAGDVVIPKAEAAEYAKVVALNLKPDEIVAAVRERDELRGTTQQFTTKELAHQIAGVAKLDAEGFAAHMLAKNLTGEVKDVTEKVNGKDVVKRVAYVKPAGDDKAQPVPVTEYLAKLPAFEQRALQVTTTAPAVPVGTPWPLGQQPAPVGGPSTDPTADFIKKQADRGKAKPNPLTPTRQLVTAGVTAQPA